MNQFRVMWKNVADGLSVGELASPSSLPLHLRSQRYYGLLPTVMMTVPGDRGKSKK